MEVYILQSIYLLEGSLSPSKPAAYTQIEDARKALAQEKKKIHKDWIEGEFMVIADTPDLYYVDTLDDCKYWLHITKSKVKGEK